MIMCLDVVLGSTDVKTQYFSLPISRTVKMNLAFVCHCASIL